MNHELSRRRAIQLQRVHLALLYARMGRTESALKQANYVRVASARMLTAIYCRLTSGHDALDRGKEVAHSAIETVKEEGGQQTRELASELKERVQSDAADEQIPS